jgi:hypothetical protein
MVCTVTITCYWCNYGFTKSLELVELVIELQIKKKLDLALDIHNIVLEIASEVT